MDWRTGLVSTPSASAFLRLLCRLWRISLPVLLCWILSLVQRVSSQAKDSSEVGTKMGGNKKGIRRKQENIYIYIYQISIFEKRT